MLSIEAAILRTILYADVFQYPLTLDEIHRYLIHNEYVTQAKLEDTLAHSTILKAKLSQIDGYICLTNREAIITIRTEREVISSTLWKRAIWYGNLLSHIPFVRMVALTGALAMRNPSSEKDDFDYLLITKPNRVWLARAFAIILVRVVRLFGRELCPNYVVASDQLTQSRQDLYMAHEVTQMRHIYGAMLYRAMSEQNAWTQDYLPNALPHMTAKDTPRRMRRIIEHLLDWSIGDWLENWEYQRKQKKFKVKINQPQSSAEISNSVVKGHFDDHGQPVLAQYEQRLYEYGLLAQDTALAGD